MDCYHIWCDLKESHKDLEFAESVRVYMSYLVANGLIEGYRLTRRKLGFGPQELGEFHIIIETKNMAQLEETFQGAAARRGEFEEVHSAVYRSVKNARFALYRDFPDAVRTEAD